MNPDPNTISDRYRRMALRARGEDRPSEGGSHETIDVSGGRNFRESPARAGEYHSTTTRFSYRFDSLVPTRKGLHALSALFRNRQLCLTWPHSSFTRLLA